MGDRALRIHGIGHNRDKAAQRLVKHFKPRASVAVDAPLLQVTLGTDNLPRSSAKKLLPLLKLKDHKD